MFLYFYFCFLFLIWYKISIVNRNVSTVEAEYWVTAQEKFDYCIYLITQPPGTASTVKWHNNGVTWMIEHLLGLWQKYTKWSHRTFFQFYFFSSRFVIHLLLMDHNFCRCDVVCPAPSKILTSKICLFRVKYKQAEVIYVNCIAYHLVI